MINDLDHDELLYWLAFNSIEPIDNPWIRDAHVCSTIANANRSRKQPYKLEDFLLIRDREKQVDVGSVFSFFKRAGGKTQRQA